MAEYSIKQTVVIPMEKIYVPIVEKTWEPDPLWDKIDFVPDNALYCIVTDNHSISDNIPVFGSVMFSKNPNPLTVDWGDGTIETVDPNIKAVSHFYQSGTGKPDSRGNTTWLLKINSATLQDVGYELGRNPLLATDEFIYENSIIYCCCGQLTQNSNGLITYNNISPNDTVVGGMLEGVRMFGKDIYSYPILRYANNLRSIEFDNGALCYRFPSRSIGDNPFISKININFVPDTLYNNALFMGISLNEKLDMSSWVYNGANPDQFQLIMGSGIREAIFPNTSENVSSLNSATQSCKQLEKLILPSTLKNCNSIRGMCRDTFILRELFLPMDLGENVTNVDGLDAFNNCYFYGEINTPYAKYTAISCNSSSIFVGQCRISGLKFHPQSPFSASGTQINLYGNMMGIDALKWVFDNLPVWTDSIKRTIDIRYTIGEKEVTKEMVQGATDKKWTVLTLNVYPNFLEDEDSLIAFSPTNPNNYLTRKGEFPLDPPAKIIYLSPVDSRENYVEIEWAPTN